MTRSLGPASDHGSDRENAIDLQDEAQAVSQELRMRPLTERILVRREILRAQDNYLRLPVPRRLGSLYPADSSLEPDSNSRPGEFKAVRITSLNALPTRPIRTC